MLESGSDMTDLQQWLLPRVAERGDTAAGTILRLRRGHAPYALGRREVEAAVA